MTETDPSGRKPHEAGAKLDAGKPKPALVLGEFSRALWEVSKVGTYGAEKYSASGWVAVPNGEARYADAQMRHWLKHQMGLELDDETNLPHLAHEAWGALAKLDLLLRRLEKEGKWVP